MSTATKRQPPDKVTITYKEDATGMFAKAHIHDLHFCGFGHTWALAKERLLMQIRDHYAEPNEVPPPEVVTMDEILGVSSDSD